MRKKIGGLAAVLLLLLLWTIPVPAAGGLANLQQTDAGTKTVSLSWERPGKAVSYEVYSSPYGEEDYQIRKSIHAASSKVRTKITVSSRETGKYYDLRVLAFDQEGKEVAREELKRCPTLPEAVTGIRQQSLYTSRKMKLRWNRQETASGYQVETYLLSDQDRDLYTVRSTYGTVPLQQDQLYRLRIRGYVNLQVDGKTKRVYGPYGVTYTALQPRVTFQGGDEQSVIAQWKPVEGAESYAVFVSTKQKSGYKRVAIAYEPTAVIEHLKPNTRYYVLVRTNKRVNGVLHRSPSTYVYPVRIDTEGRVEPAGSGFEAEM